MAINDEIWHALASGGASAPENPHQLKMLLVRIRNLSMHPDRALRLEALRVAARLGTADAIYAAADYAQDSDLEVRRELAAIAADHGRSGLPVFRQLALDPDPLLAVESVRRLTNLRDRASTSRMRGLLKARHGVVRHQAAVFLGLFGGPSVVPVLKRQESDEDQGVRAAVQWAVDRIEGRTDAPPPALGTAGSEAPSVEPPSITPPETVPDGPPDPEAAGAPHVPAAPATPSAGAPDPEPAGKPPEPEQTDEPTPADDEAEDSGAMAPDAISTLFEQLAQATEPEARDALIQHLRQLDETSLSAAFRACRVNEEPLRNQGAALAAAALDNPRWITPIRKLTASSDPAVRAAVAETLGALCTPGVYTQLERLAVDTDLSVHGPALRALAEGARRIGYQDQARKLIERLPETRDPGLLKIRSAALKVLESSE